MAQRVTIRDFLRVTQSQSGDYGGELSTGFPDLDLLWGPGTAASQSDDFWDDIGVTLANGATRNLDLKALTAGPGGSAPNFVEIRGLWIRCRDFALTFAKGAANGWTGLGAAWTITPPAGTWVRFINPNDAGLPVGAGSKVIDISNASGSLATYDILAVGVTA